MIALGFLLGIISAFFWSAWIVTSSAILSAGHLSYNDLLFIRYIAPFIIGIVCLCFNYKHMHKYHLPSIILAGIFGATVYPTFALLGFSYMSGWKAGIILNSAIPLFTFCIVTYFYKFNKYALISVFLMIISNLLLMLNIGVNYVGCAMILISAMGMSIYLFMVGNQRMPIGIIASVMPIIGFLSIMPYILITGINIDNMISAGLSTMIMIFILHGVLSGFIATLFLTISSKLTGPQTASLTTALVPSMAVLLDYYFVQTGNIDYRGVISLALCTIGIVIYGLWGKPKAIIR